jgi:hypothetical protein
MSQSAHQTRLALVALALIALTGTAAAEVVSMDNCNDCSAGNLPWGCTITSATCNRTTIWEEVFAGVPTAHISGTENCENCPTVSGVPCTDVSGYEGSTLDCAIIISDSIACQVEIDYTAAGGISVGIFQAAIELHLGFSITQTVTVSVSGQATAGWCRKVSMRAEFTNKVGAVSKVTISHWLENQLRCPDGSTPVIPTSCDSGSAEVTYDSRTFQSTLQMVSDDPCDSSNF